jgi:tape measure domain-containing protein
MATIARLQALLTLNNRGYVAGMQRSRGHARGFGRDSRNAGRDVQAMSRVAVASAKRIAIGFGALVGIGGTAAGFGLGLKLAADAEQAEAAFSTLLRSRDAARNLLRDLDGFAAATPFQLPELRNAARSLVAFGVTQDRVLPTLRNIGDVAAGTNQRIGEIAEIYGKARVQGRLFMEDINQLTGRGIPIITLLARQFGVAESEVRGLVTQGHVGFPQIEQAFAAMTAKGGQFNGMMSKQSQTAAGLVSTLRDNLGQELKAWGEGIMQGLQVRRRIGQTIEAIQRYGPAVRGAAADAKAWTIENASTAKNLAYLTAGIYATAKALPVLKTTTLATAAAMRTYAAGISLVNVASGLYLARHKPLMAAMLLTKKGMIGIKAAIFSSTAAFGLAAVAIGGITAAFVKSRIEGTSYSDATLDIVDSLRRLIGMSERAALTVQRANAAYSNSGKKLEEAQAALRNADGAEAAIEAQRQINRVLRERIDNLEALDAAETRLTGNATRSSTIIGRFQDDLTQGEARLRQMREQHEAARRQATQQQAAATASQEQTNRIRDVVQQLQDEARTLGFSEAQLRRYRLQQLGATEATIAHAQAIAEQVQAFRGLADIADPLERFDAIILNLNRRLLEIGNASPISVDQYSAMLSQAREQLMQSLAGDDAADPVAAFDRQTRRLRELMRAGTLDAAQYAAAIAGSQQQLRDALNLDDAGDDLERTRDRLDQLNAAAERGIIDRGTYDRLKEQARQSLLGSLGITEIKSPLEQYENRLSTLSDALDIGAISWGQYRRQVRAARRELEQVGGRERFTLTTSAADVQLARLDARAEAQAQRGGGLDNRLGRLPELAEQDLEQSRQTVATLRRIEQIQQRPIVEVDLA